MRRGLLFAGALLVAAAGCKEKAKEASSAEARPAGGEEDAGRAPDAPERVVLERVELRATGSKREVEIDAPELEATLRRELIRSGWFFAEASDVPDRFSPRPGRLEVALHYDVVEGAGRGGGRAIVAAVEAELSLSDRSDALELHENVLAEHPLEHRERASDAMIEDHAARAVRSIVPGLVAKEKLRGAPVSKLVGVLEGKDVELSLWALKIIGERHLTGALDQVLALLDSEDSRLRDGAIGTLVALDDPRAVHPLTKHADFSDYDRLRTIIEAVTAIGGPDAIEFLEFVASGHPDDDIKQRAQDGLDRIRRHQRR